MKKLFILIFPLITLVSFAQSSGLELEHVKAKFENGLISLDEYQKMGREWSRIVEKYDGYPHFPINEETNHIEFVFIDTLDNFSKKEIYDRVMEYNAIIFANINYTLHHQNYETGKIILKGHFVDYYLKDAGWLLNPNKQEVTKLKIDFTIQTTIKDSRIKTKITNIQVTTYIVSIDFKAYDYREYSFELPLSLLYPITNYPLKDWEDKLQQLMTIRDRLITYSKLQVNYILDKPDDYTF
jgi:hypothetical protein